MDGISVNEIKNALSPQEILELAKTLSREQLLTLPQLANLTPPAPPVEPPKPPVTPTEQWEYLADEYQSFTLSQPARVRYGANDKWLTKDLPAGTHQVSNDLFGGDPQKGAIKKAYRLVTGESPKPNPLPTPQPTPVQPPVNVSPIQNPQTLTFTRDPNNVRGVGRGISENVDTASNRFKNFQDKGTDVYRVIVSLQAFKNNPLPQNFLEHLDNYFGQMRSKGVSGNILFHYWWGSSAEAAAAFRNGSTDTTPLWMLRHLEQLASVLQGNADVINYLPMGLVGAWGEWNKATSGLGIENNSDAASSGRRQLLRQVLQVLPKERMAALRYPQHYREIYGSKRIETAEAYTGTEQARTGLFYDYYPADYDQDDWADIGRITQYKVFGGEGVPSSFNEGRARQALREFAACHWHHMQPMFQSQFRSFGIYDELLRRMGYRYVLKRGAMPQSVRGSEVLRIDLEIENEGFAALHNPKHLDVVLRNRSSGNVVKISAFENSERDARRILPRPGTTKVIALGAQLQAVPVGSYDVALHVKDVFASIANRPEYSLRFANQNTWSPSTGFNHLGQVQVGV